MVRLPVLFSQHIDALPSPQVFVNERKFAWYAQPTTALLHPAIDQRHPAKHA